MWNNIALSYWIIMMGSFIISSVSWSLEMPIVFGIHRVADPSMHFQKYLEKLGAPLSNTTSNYNLISLDGYKYSQSQSSQITPISIYLNCYRYLMANRRTIYGGSDEQVRGTIIERIHKNKKKLLMNVDLKEAPITKGLFDSSSIAIDVVNKIRQLSTKHIDGISIEFEDYNAVAENIASNWLMNLLLKIREEITDSGFIIVLSIPAVYARQISFFKLNIINSLINYYVLKYYNTQQDAYTSYDQIFQNAPYPLSETALFQIGTSSSNIDICRTLIAKPVHPQGSWNPQQYLQANVLKSIFQRAFNKGWFGGFANLELQSDGSQQFASTVMSPIVQGCKQNRDCIC